MKAFFFKFSARCNFSMNSQGHQNPLNILDQMLDIDEDQDEGKKEEGVRRMRRRDEDKDKGEKGEGVSRMRRRDEDKDKGEKGEGVSRMRRRDDDKNKGEKEEGVSRVRRRDDDKDKGQKEEGVSRMGRTRAASVSKGTTLQLLYKFRMGVYMFIKYLFHHTH